MTHGAQHIILKLNRPGNQQRRVRLLKRHGGLLLLYFCSLCGGGNGTHGARKLWDGDRVKIVVDGGGAAVDGEGGVELEGGFEGQVASEQVQTGTGAGSQRCGEGA
jgi:hypothetical protein